MHSIVFAAESQSAGTVHVVPLLRKIVVTDYASDAASVAAKFANVVSGVAGATSASVSPAANETAAPPEVVNVPVRAAAAITIVPTSLNAPGAAAVALRTTIVVLAVAATVPRAWLAWPR